MLSDRIFVRGSLRSILAGHVGFGTAGEASIGTITGFTVYESVLVGAIVLIPLAGLSC